MIAVDTNVLVFAHREEARWHTQATRALRSLAEGDAPWGVPAPCVAEFVRVVTHARVFRPPTPLAVALDFVDRLAASPTFRLLTPGEDFLPLYRAASEQGAASGNLAFDAQIAAICKERGALDILTEDRDFARFATPRMRTLDAQPRAEPHDR
jgi:hypothetical protein